MNSASTLLQNVWGPSSWILLALAGLVGLVALVSPKTFRSVAEFGGRWLDSEKLLAKLDRKIDVDRLVMPYSRWLGAAVVAAIAILCFRFSVH